MITLGLPTYEEQQMRNESGVKIILPVNGQHVPIGELVVIET